MMSDLMSHLKFLLHKVQPIIKVLEHREPFKDSFMLDSDRCRDVEEAFGILAPSHPKIQKYNSQLSKQNYLSPLWKSVQ